MKNNTNFASEIEKSLNGREAQVRRELARSQEKEPSKQESSVPKTSVIELNLIKKPSGLAHSRSFYLRDDTYERLKNFAEENETSVSEVISKLIEKVLP